jgi:hypothetical protein
MGCLKNIAVHTFSILLMIVPTMIVIVPLHLPQTTSTTSLSKDNQMLIFRSRRDGESSRTSKKRKSETLPAIPKLPTNDGDMSAMMPRQDPTQQSQLFKEVSVPRRTSAREERISRILQDPDVQRQIDRPLHRPYFVWLVSAVQIIMLLVSLIVNQQLTGSVIETNPLNIMIGPGAYVTNYIRKSS